MSSNRKLYKIEKLKASLAEASLRIEKLEAESRQRSHIQHRLNLIHKIDQYLTTSNLNLLKVSDILELICKHFGWNFAAFWQKDPSENFILSYSWSSDSTKMRFFEVACREISFPPGVGLLNKVWEKNKFFWSPDITKEINFMRAQIALKADLHGAFIFPVHFEGKSIGILEFFSNQIEPAPEATFLTDFEGIELRISQLIDRIKLENEIAQQKSNLVNSSKMAALGEMAGGIAHEINTPLAVIKMRVHQLSRLLTKPQLDVENIKNMVHVIDTTTDQITKIIQSLRFFSRNSEQDPMVEEQLPNIINETLTLCSQKLLHQGISFKLGDIPQVQIKCRPVQISQVFLNLLSNASDAIVEQPDKWITLSAINNNNMIEVRVTDSGDGISQEIEDKLFQPFFTTKPVGKGTGLGLSISKGIMQGHGGDLAIDRTSKNTCFVLRLPKL